MKPMETRRRRSSLNAAGEDGMLVIEGPRWARIAGIASYLPAPRPTYGIAGRGARHAAPVFPAPIRAVPAGPRTGATERHNRSRPQRQAFVISADCPALREPTILLQFRQSHRYSCARWESIGGSEL